MMADREKIARAIYAANPPMNPHGPNSDLIFGEPYVRSYTESAYRAADAVLKIVDERENDLILRWKSAEDALARVYKGEQEALAEVERLKEHSILLNHLSWRMAKALGDVPPEMDRIEGDPEEMLTRLLSRTDAAATLTTLTKITTREAALQDGLRALDRALDDGRAGGVIYTYGQVQSRLRALLAPTEAPIDPFWEREHP